MAAAAAMVGRRSAARAAKDFGEADRLRDTLWQEFGVRCDDRNKRWGFGGLEPGRRGAAENIPQCEDIRVPPLFSEHADRECRRPGPGRRAPKDASHRDLSDATLRFDLALDVCCRRAPKGCQK